MKEASPMRRLLAAFPLLLALACAKAPPPKPDMVTLSVPYELDTLDPHAKNRLSEYALLSNVYEPLAKTAIGTGPYRYVSWKPAEEIRFTRNDAYWGPRPPVKDALYRLGRAPEQALQDLVAQRSSLVQCGSKRLEAVAKDAGDVTI